MTKPREPIYKQHDFPTPKPRVEFLREVAQKELKEKKPVEHVLGYAAKNVGKIVQGYVRAHGKVFRIGFLTNNIAPTFIMTHINGWCVNEAGNKLDHIAHNFIMGNTKFQGRCL